MGSLSHALAGWTQEQREKSAMAFGELVVAQRALSAFTAEHRDAQKNSVRLAEQVAKAADRVKEMKEACAELAQRIAAEQARTT